MISRTYGWVQNPSDFNKLKLVVQILSSGNSEHYKNLKDQSYSQIHPLADVKTQLLKKLNSNCTEFSYTELVGTSKNINGNPAKVEKKPLLMV